MPRSGMRYVIKAGAGFSVVTVAAVDPWDALERARDLVEQGMQNFTVTDPEGEVRTTREFEQIIGEPAPEAELS